MVFGGMSTISALLPLIVFETHGDGFGMINDKKENLDIKEVFFNIKKKCMI
jgi:hypothetical protein